MRCKSSTTITPCGTFSQASSALINSVTMWRRAFCCAALSRERPANAAAISDSGAVRQGISKGSSAATRQVNNCNGVSPSSQPIQAIAAPACAAWSCSRACVSREVLP